jgi:hypothetical protein
VYIYIRPGQDSQIRTGRTGQARTFVLLDFHAEQNRQNRTPRAGLLEWNYQNGTGRKSAMTGRQGKDRQEEARQNRIGRTGQAEQDRQEKHERQTGQAKKVQSELGEAEQDRQNRTGKIG